MHFQVEKVVLLQHRRNGNGSENMVKKKTTDGNPEEKEDLRTGFD